MAKLQKILIIEDEKTLARALELKLSLSGFEVKMFLMVRMESCFLKNNYFLIVLLDLIMPKMDGFTVLENLKIKKNKNSCYCLN